MGLGYGILPLRRYGTFLYPHKTGITLLWSTVQLTQCPWVRRRLIHCYNFSETPTREPVRQIQHRIVPTATGCTCSPICETGPLGAITTPRWTRRRALRSFSSQANSMGSIATLPRCLPLRNSLSGFHTQSGQDYRGYMFLCPLMTIL